MMRWSIAVPTGYRQATLFFGVAVLEVRIGPRQGLCPWGLERLSAIPIEVQLFVQLDEQATIERKVPGVGA